MRMNGESLFRREKERMGKRERKGGIALHCASVVLCWLRGLGGRCGTTTHCL